MDRTTTTPGRPFNPLLDIPLYRASEDCTFKEKVVRIIPDTISHFSNHPGDLLFIAGASVATACAYALASTLIPVFLTPVIVYNPPVIGFAGYPLINTLLGGVPGLAGGYLVNKLLAEPAKDTFEAAEEGWARTILRYAAKLQLFTLAGALLGAPIIPKGHASGLITPLF